MSRCDWTERDWREVFEERAAVLEFDGGYDRATADALAREEVDAMRSEVAAVKAVASDGQVGLFG